MYIIEKEILIQKYIRELKGPKAIANDLGLPIKTVKENLYRTKLIDFDQDKALILPIGTIIGNWKVEETIPHKTNKSKYKCSCIKCGIFKEILAISLYTNKTKPCYCRICTDEKEISIYKFEKMKNSAAYRGIYFDITRDDIYEKYIEQDRKCAYSKWEVSFDPQIETASVDRKVNVKGYTKDNIQILHSMINMYKGATCETSLLFTSHCIAENSKKPECKVEDFKLKNNRPTYLPTFFETKKYLDELPITEPEIYKDIQEKKKIEEERQKQLRYEIYLQVKDEFQEDNERIVNEVFPNTSFNPGI